MSSPDRINKRAEMEALKTMRSKTASKEEKEAAAATLDQAGDSSRQAGSESETPVSKGVAKAAKRAAGSNPVQQRGAGRGR